MFPRDPLGIRRGRGLSGPHSPFLPPVVGAAANSPTVSTVASPGGPFRSGATGQGGCKTCRGSSDTRDRLLRYEKRQNSVGTKSVAESLSFATTPGFLRVLSSCQPKWPLVTRQLSPGVLPTFSAIFSSMPVLHHGISLAHQNLCAEHELNAS